jgi:hypothetical protein
MNFECPIIGVTGLIGAGKSTVQRIIQEQFGHKALSFGKCIKDACAQMHPRWSRAMLEGDTDESRMWRQQVDPFYAKKFDDPAYTPRKALQLVGTECGRSIHADMWVVAAMHEVDAAAQDPNNTQRFIFSDVRFPNEVKAIRDRGGLIVHVTRGKESESEKKAWVRMKQGKLHVSEHLTLQPEFAPDVRIVNDGSLQRLKHVVKAVGSEWTASVINSIKSGSGCEPLAQAAFETCAKAQTPDLGSGTMTCGP